MIPQQPRSSSDPRQAARPDGRAEGRGEAGRAAGRRRRLGFSIAGTVLLADQLSKAWASAALPGQPPRPLLPGLLDLVYTTNTGAAFSLFTGSTRPLAIISLLVAALVAVWILRASARVLTLPRVCALGFLLGGAAGNGIDRWRLGAVIDFLALVPVEFPVFNLADVAINLAVVCFAIELLRPPRDGDG